MRKLTYYAKRAIKKHGEDKCRKAYDLSCEGEGSYMIATELDVHHNSTSSMIDAGLELALIAGERLADERLYDTAIRRIDHND